MLWGAHYRLMLVLREATFENDPPPCGPSVGYEPLSLTAEQRYTQEASVERTFMTLLSDNTSTKTMQTA
jgi:hypothetical protein